IAGRSGHLRASGAARGARTTKTFARALGTHGGTRYTAPARLRSPEPAGRHGDGKKGNPYSQGVGFCQPLPFMNKKTEDKPEPADEADVAPRSLLDRLSQALLGDPASREDLVQLLRDAAERDLLDRDSLDMIEGVLQVSEM